MGAARQEAPALKIENVSIRFGDFKAIKNVSTSVGKTKPFFYRAERSGQNNDTGRYLRKEPCVGR